MTDDRRLEFGEHEQLHAVYLELRSTRHLEHRLQLALITPSLTPAGQAEVERLFKGSPDSIKSATGRTVTPFEGAHRSVVYTRWMHHDASRRNQWRSTIVRNKRDIFLLVSTLSSLRQGHEVTGGPFALVTTHSKALQEFRDLQTPYKIIEQLKRAAVRQGLDADKLYLLK